MTARAGREAHRGAARRDPPARAPLLRPGAPEIADEEYDRLERELRDLEARAPRAGHPRQPHAARGRAARPRSSRPSSTACRCSASTTPTARTSCGSSRSASSALVGEREIDVRGRAEDRRPVHGPALRGRPAGARGHPRRRRARRRRHARTCAPSRPCPCACTGRTCPRSSRSRGEVFLPALALRGHQPRARGGGARSRSPTRATPPRAP